MLEPNRQKELDVKSYIKGTKPHGTSPASCQTLLCHGLNIKFNLFDKTLQTVIKRSFPTDFAFSPPEAVALSHIEVDWYSASNLNIQWNDSGDHQCAFSQLNGKRLVVQRDFACFHQSDKKLLLFTDTLIDDGFFNFLRYYVPVALLKHDRFMFHSSCVLNTNKEASLFLGHSGWGKSTIASMFPQDQVLGDDMNLLHISDDEILVEPTHLGQLVTNWQKQGQQYPVKNLFWLNKSATGKKVLIKEMDATEQRLKLLGSLSGLFWDQITQDESKKVFSLLHKMMKHKTVKQYSFSLTSEVTKYV